MKCVTVILPVYNGLHFVRPCLESLAAHTDPADFPPLVLDDGSDAVTAAYLDEAVGGFADDAALFRNPTNVVSLRTCNRARESSNSLFVLLAHYFPRDSDGVLTLTSSPASNGD